MKAGSAEVRITYKGKDISRDIAPYLTAFTFTDNSGGTADDISITLADRKGLWLDAWFPAKGDKITCSVIASGNPSQSLPCGVFETDQIDYSCPPHVLTVKAVSAAISRSLKHEQHSKAWENVPLRAVASDIAGANGLALWYDAGDIQLERCEQIRQSDTAFLSELAGNYGLAVKVSEGKLIVYSEEAYDKRAESAEISSDDRKLLSWKFSSKGAKIFRKARIKYHHPVKDELYEAEEEDESAEGTERVLEIDSYCENSADAKNQCRQRLYEANKHEVTGSLELKGDIRFRAGSAVSLKGFGAFSGKFTITKAVHSVTAAGGYITSLELRKGTEAKKSSAKRRRKAQSPGRELYYEGNNYYGYKGN